MNGDDALCARPLGVTPRPVWILGASPATMELAACLGTGYGHSLIFGGGLATGPDLMATYHKEFVPTPPLGEAAGRLPSRSSAPIRRVVQYR
ncbi:MAG: hypothetical protein M3Q09_06845 [Gemmatimonadota bacterium]|nr:hypothetical protein [Gemmatimonadota bacterium]